MAITSVTKILESVQNSYGLTRTLGEIQLWREEDRSVFYRVGNSVVLFKIRYQGEWRAMRCYTRCVPNIAEIYGDRYLPGELYVYTGIASGKWIDVVLVEWVDGVTLKERVERAVEEGDSQTLKIISDRFEILAKELLGCDWAHGDLTAENIMVTPELQIRLIDFDGKFLPQFQGKTSPELGTVAYQPPTRGISDFDRNIDDYSIALISTALRALSVDINLYHKCRFDDGLLFSPALIDRGTCKALDECVDLFLSHNTPLPYRVATLLRMGTLRIAPLAEIFQSINPTSLPSSSLEFTMRHGYVGYATADGGVVIPNIYDDGLEFREGVVMVRLDTKWLAISPSGRVVLSFEGYERVKSLRKGVARCLRDGVWEQISVGGDFVD